MAMANKLFGVEDLLIGSPCRCRRSPEVDDLLASLFE